MKISKRQQAAILEASVRAYKKAYEARKATHGIRMDFRELQRLSQEEEQARAFLFAALPDEEVA